MPCIFCHKALTRQVIDREAVPAFRLWCEWVKAWTNLDYATIARYCCKHDLCAGWHARSLLVRAAIQRVGVSFYERILLFMDEEQMPADSKPFWVGRLPT
jgi:hypothetical protein